jgi:hypothetical protein
MTKGSLRYAAWNLIIPVLCALPADADQVCPVKDLGGHLDASWVSQYARHPFSDFSRDYFSYYCRDPDAAPGDHEVMLDAAWRIVLPDDAARLTRLMAEDLRVFLAERMDLRLPVAESSRNTPRPRWWPGPIRHRSSGLPTRRRRDSFNAWEAGPRC